MIRPAAALAGALLLASTTLSPAAPQAAAPLEFTPVDQLRLDRAEGDASGWLHTNGSYRQTRLFPGSEITPENVGRLRPAFVFQTGITDGMQTTPVVANGVLYFTTAWNHVYAIDAATGAQIWHYKHELRPGIAHCCGPNNRGVAIGGERVFLATLDASLVALDARTGAKLWEAQVADPERGYSLTMAPTVVDDKVLIGSQGGEYGIRGFLKAYDAGTGAALWTFHTIPEQGSEGVWATRDATGADLLRDIPAEQKRFAEHGVDWQTLGGPVWQNPAIDRETGTVYFMAGNPGPDLDGSSRPGDNLYTNSLIAIGLEDGRYRCHFQYVPHDRWDMDPASPPVLADVRDDQGQVVPGLVHGSKLGYVFVHDRRDCSLIRYSESLVPQQGRYSLPTPEGTRMAPGSSGGVSWSPMAVDENLGLGFAMSMHLPMIYRLEPAPYQPGKPFLGGMLMPADEPRWGYVSAVDLHTGRIAWKRRVDAPMTGGVLALASGLVFAGQGDGLFTALDARSGELLWQFNCGAGVNAPPIAYSIGGREYIAVAAGGNVLLGTRRGSSLFVFSLPDDGPPGQRAASALAPSTQESATAAHAQEQGAEVPSDVLAGCASCHGDDGRPVRPDYPVLAGQTEQYLYNQLRDFSSGAREHEVMGPLARELDPGLMRQLAAHYAAQDWPAGTAPDSDRALIEAGRAAAERGRCAQCHLPGYTGVGATPRLAGQHVEYLARTMRDYRSGARANAAVMSALLRDYDDGTIEALARYLSRP